MSHFGKKKVHKAAVQPAGKTDIDSFVKKVRAEISAKEADYRRRALSLFPWICTKCGRTFDETSLQLLTVHHRDSNHDNNPPDGSNWELLCAYCHDDEHSRALLADYMAGTSDSAPVQADAPKTGEGGSGMGSLGAALGKFLQKKDGK
jgi:hypothetical protein